MSRITSRKRSGPATRFPDKVRQPVSVQLTAQGHEQLGRHIKRLSRATASRVSQSDFFQMLLVQFGDQITADML